MAKKPGPTALLFVGNAPQTIEAAASAIVSVLKAASTEGAQIAACNTLSALVHATDNTSISDCCFDSGGKS